MKKLSRVLGIIMLAIVQTVTFAGEPYDPYIYQDQSGTGIIKEYPSISTYEPEEVLTGKNLGTNEFKSPRDLFAYDDELYVLDSGNGRVVIIDEDQELVRIMDEFSYQGKEETLNDPNGLMVTEEGIYIADTENQRILQMNDEGEIQMIFTRPDSSFINQEVPFSPQKVVVDSVGNVYTNAKGVFEGLVEYDKEGNFTGFFGGDKINNLFEIADLIFWKNILTEEQQSKMKKVVPIEYGNLMIDDKNFIYTVSQGTGNKGAIRKMNWKGRDLFGMMEGVASVGYGDLKPGAEQSSFVDVCIDEQELLYALDTTTGRVFQYDQQGNMLSVFGRYGSQTGTFRGPIAIESFGEKIYVLDHQLHNITVFSKTEFGKLMSQATQLYDDGRYQEAAVLWKQIVEINPNFMLAYTGIGKAELLEEDYESALECFRTSGSWQDYSDAFKMYRTQFVKDNFALIGIVTIAAVILLFWILAMIKRKKFSFIGEYIKEHNNVQIMLLPFKAMIHPIEGFEDIKFRNKGSRKLAYALTALLFIAFSVEWLYTGFIFTTTGEATFTLILMLMQTVGMLAIWVLSNYALCSLMDGKAKFSEVFISTTYALLPLMLGMLINVGLSHVLTLEEAFIMQIISSITLSWTLLLIVMSLMILHQYTLKKTIGTIILTLFGVVSILFLIALCFILYNQVMTFIRSVYSEILLRM